MDATNKNKSTPNADDIANAATSIFEHAKSIEASARRLRDADPTNDAAAVRSIVRAAWGIVRDAAVVVAGVWVWTSVIAPALT